MSAMFEFAATLTRELPVRIINVSASGCLVESLRRMEVGTMGTLELRLGGQDFEVVRCEAVQGAPNVYHVAVRLLWTRPRKVGSIRHAVASLVAERDGSETARLM
jgi:hypothetical protein